MINLYHKILTYFIAFIWLINGLFCKVLPLVPRHQEIVSRILNAEYSNELTIFIGILEIMMAIWIITGNKSKLNAIIQIIIVLIMNIIEFFYASDLLLWGKFNIIFALLFSIVVYYNEFRIKKKYA